MGIEVLNKRENGSDFAIDQPKKTGERNVAFGEVVVDKVVESMRAGDFFFIACRTQL